MPSKYVHTTIDGQQLKLSNLQKQLYDNPAMVKAEVIEYHMNVAKYMLPHLAGRPLTLIRYPDGVHGERFYAKNKPKWTPEWVPTYQPPWDDGNEFIVVKKLPELVWLANLAALELHPMVVRMDRPNNPDQFIIDLDPDDGFSFEDLKQLSLEIKDHAEAHGYVPFIKTSGGKGLHIVLPIRPKHDFKTVMKSMKGMLQPFVSARSHTTFQVHKDKRKGKVLIDIYRNHQGNSCVAPYSLRGKEGAPVSMPFVWSMIDEVKDAQQFNLTNAVEHLQQNGDAWDTIESTATDLHNHRPKVSPVDQPSLYDKKRDLASTPEPSFDIDMGINGLFCIQLHDATNLHYDLRIGIDGVLKSWAIPKGLPSKPGIKRLCINTEDHPPKYIDFEGVIPQDAYGGGEMWLFDKGEIEWITQKKSKLRFKLIGKWTTAEYLLYRIKDDQWLIERKDQPQKDYFELGIKPMLSDSTIKLPTAAHKYYYEIKWDGIRAIIYKRDKEIKIISRSGRDITERFPDLVIPKNIEVEEFIADAEIVVLDEIGRPVFSDVISRMHTSPEAVKHVVKSKPAICYFFDVLYLDGYLLSKVEAVRRHSYLRALIKTNDHYRISERFDDGPALLEATRSMQLEGIMIKRKDGPYLAGQRSDNWQKLKFRSSMDCIVLGFTEGTGDRALTFGSLQLAELVGGNFEFRGRVGTGFDTSKLNKISSLLNEIISSEKPIDQQVEEEKRTTWIEPKYWVEIEYASLTDNGTLREPVFQKMWSIASDGSKDLISF